MDRRLLEYRPEIDAFGIAETSLDTHTMRSSGSEMQHAAELLEHAETGELESYLVELIDRAARSPERPVTQALAGILNRTAQRLLQHDGSPSVALAGRVFGIELEGLSAEDQAFEVARRFVRFATEAAQRVQRARAAASPQAAALCAASSAARTLAPGLLASPVHSARPTGSWFRRGRQLIVLNP